MSYIDSIKKDGDNIIIEKLCILFFLDTVYVPLYKI